LQTQGQAAPRREAPGFSAHISSVTWPNLSLSSFISFPAPHKPLERAKSSWLTFVLTVPMPSIAIGMRGKLLRIFSAHTLKGSLG